MSSSSESAATRARPLNRAEANEVLRYWLASLQLEEALAARPRARRVFADAPPPRVDAPSPGQEYFKVGLDASVEALLCKRAGLQKPLDVELGAFFETWLTQQYRRGSDDRELAHLLAFPVVHLPRGELAGLLRCGLRLEFGNTGGPPFRVPTRSERRRKEFPQPPTEVRLIAADRTARQWPFFVDTRLLHQQLGVARESIDALFEALRKQPELSERRMLSMICELLESELAAASGATSPPPPSGDATLLGRITAAMSGLIARRGGRARAYPVGIVLDATRAKTTWHLQRELGALLEESPEVAWDLDSCLGSYLTGAARPSALATQRALFSRAAMSESQLAAAERCWGSVLTAVQGPPGTGKSTLILQLAAEALVRQIDSLVDHGTMGDGLLVVTSTNNRAVDNVVDPLNASASGGLPLALRAGSQRVCEQLLAPQLAQAHTWLERARQLPAAERSAALAAALDRFKHVRASVEALLAPRARVLAARGQRMTLELELAKLRSLESEPGADWPQLTRAIAGKLVGPLEKAHERLTRLAELCEATPGIAQLNAVVRHYRSSEKRSLRVLEEALSAARLELDLGLPPALPPSTDPAALMGAWEKATGAALAQLEGLTEQLTRAVALEERRARVAHLERQLALLPPGDAELPDISTDDSLQRQLFEAAAAVREAWAAAQSDELAPLVQTAQHVARNDASLRQLWSDEQRSWRPLRQLFGLWGCTLLSLGNCFPAQQGSIAHLIIDEAGQCHPAYAVSGLLRSGTALVIGDVHQLEPVIDLEESDDERVIESCKLSLGLAALAPYRVHADARSSVQALADRAVQIRPRLIDHFRCQPEIIAICDELCGYGLQVHTRREGPLAAVPFLEHAVSLVDIAGEQTRLGGSWYNAAELELTLELCQALIACGTQPDEIAVITPYRGQLEQLRKAFVREGIPVDHSVELLDLEEAASARGGRGAALGTVHRFQGGERSIVLFSSVATRRGSLAFLDDRENLLNVAISRARHRFITLGQRSLLAQGRRTSLLTSAAHPLEADAFRRGTLSLF